MIAVFLGPSLPRARAMEILGTEPATILPPAAQGDIYRCWRTRPEIIVLIDGYFNEVPAPWHKEILWAMSHNTHVIGASSMGALRAAELAAYGMTGVGEVFRGYLEGHLISDDEVALLHSDADSDYAHFSVPMVDIRATLKRALDNGILSDAEHFQLLDAALSLPYGKRNYTALTRLYDKNPNILNFAKWVESNAVSQKALDAEEALKLAISPERPKPMTPLWTFERTGMWDDLVRKHSTGKQDPHNFDDDDKLDALEKDVSLHRKMSVSALARLLAVDHAHRVGRKVSDNELMNTLNQLRQRLNLESPEKVSRWMNENNLSIESLTHLLEAEIHLSEALSAFVTDIAPHLLDQMRIDGVYHQYGQSKK